MLSLLLLQMENNMSLGFSWLLLAEEGDDKCSVLWGLLSEPP